MSETIFDQVNNAILPNLYNYVRDWLPGGRIQGNEYVVRNPMRDDRKPGSFSVNVKTGMWADFAIQIGGKDPISLYAYLNNKKQGEAAKELAHRHGIKLAGGFDSQISPNKLLAPTNLERTSPGSNAGESRHQTQFDDADPIKRGFTRTVHDYHEADGSLAYQKLRYDPPDGSGERKRFLFRHKGNNGEWLNKRGRASALPYNLPQLLERRNEAIYIPEGEKCADALIKLGLLATSIEQGHEVEAAEWLEDRDLVLLPDNDETGQNRANNLLDALKSKAATIRWLELPGLPEKGDVFDWLADDSRGLSDFRELESGARLEFSEPPLVATAERWIGKEPDPIEFVVDPCVPRNVVSTMVADGGTGKSVLAQFVMTCITAGKPVFGLEVIQGDAVGLFAEDPEIVLQHRQKAICKALDIDLRDIAESLHIGSLVDRDVRLWKDDKPTDFMRQLEEFIERRPDVRLLVLDNRSDFYGDNENARPEVAAFMRYLGRICSKFGIAILLLAHTSKSQSEEAYLSTSGSTAWVNSSRSVIRLSNNSEGGSVIILEHIKANFGRKLKRKIELEWSNGMLLERDKLGMQSAQAMKQVTDDKLFLELMADAKKIGQRLGDSRQSQNFAPRVFMRAFRDKVLGRTLDDLEQAMYRLLKAGKIKHHVYDKSRGGKELILAGHSGGEVADSEDAADGGEATV